MFNLLKFNLFIGRLLLDLIYFYLLGFMVNIIRFNLIGFDLLKLNVIEFVLLKLNLIADLTFKGLTLLRI